MSDYEVGVTDTIGRSIIIKLGHISNLHIWKVKVLINHKVHFESVDHTAVILKMEEFLSQPIILSQPISGRFANDLPYCHLFKYTAVSPHIKLTIKEPVYLNDTARKTLHELFRKIKLEHTLGVFNGRRSNT